MSKDKLIYKYVAFQNALDKLEEITNLEPEGGYIQDACIKRFEITFITSWKLLKTYLDFQGVSGINSPREIFHEAMKRQLLENEDIYFDMIKTRNITTSVYDENQAKNIHQKIIEVYLDEFKELKKTVKITND